MLENTSGNAQARSILTKGYEIAYALFRIASQIAEKDFGEQLRVSGTALLTATAKEDYPATEDSLRVMECLVKFAGDVNIIGTGNSDVLLKEIYALEAGITEAKKISKADRIDFAGIFSEQEFTAKPAISQKPAIEDNPAIRQSAKKEEPAVERQVTYDAEASSNNINTILKSAIRQTAILDRIRQSGNCRLKDILEMLPGTSERTLRYDLQTLLEQDLIERVGIAGPSVYYRAKQAV